MKSLKALFVVLALMVLVPFAAASNMKAYEKMVENIDAVQAMAFANQWKWTQSSITTHVTPKEVVFEFPGSTPLNGTIKKVPLPEDKMVVAIAPYLTYTHGWVNHYMSSCQGELTNSEVHVKAVGQDGTVLVDKTVQTMANGFFELWLPRNENINVTIQGFNKTAIGMVDTFLKSKTCLTTFQLK